MIRVDTDGPPMPCADIAEFIQSACKPKVRTVAWARCARGGGLIAVLPVSDLYLYPAAHFGGIQRVSSLNEVQGIQEEQYQNRVGRIATLLNLGGYHPLVANSLQHLVPLSADTAAGGRAIAWRQDANGPAVIVPQNRSLFMPADDATRLGLVRGTATSREDLAKSLGLNGVVWVAERPNLRLMRTAADRRQARDPHISAYDWKGPSPVTVGATRVAISFEVNAEGSPARFRPTDNSDMILTAESDGKTYEARIERGSPGYGATPIIPAMPIPLSLIADEPSSSVLLITADRKSRHRGATVYEYRLPELSLRGIVTLGGTDDMPSAFCEAAIVSPTGEVVLILRQDGSETPYIAIFRRDGTRLTLQKVTDPGIEPESRVTLRNDHDRTLVDFRGAMLRTVIKDAVISTEPIPER